jgi:ATP-dependent protease ClpP protease subunit
MLKLLILSFSLLLTPILFSKEITLHDYNTVILDLPFDRATVNEVITAFQQKPPFFEKYLIIISPGGEVVAGLDMIDALNGISSKINTITIFAASMGFAAVQGLGKRYITEHGVLMSHRAFGGMQGSFPQGELESRLNFWTKRIEDLDTLTVKRTNGKMDLKQYQDLYSKEMWCEGQNCVNLGFADEVVKIKCASTLVGVTKKNITINFMGRDIDLVVERNLCPLIQGYKLVTASVQGKQIKSKTSIYTTFVETYMENLNKNTLIRK